MSLKNLKKITAVVGLFFFTHNLTAYSAHNACFNFAEKTLEKARRKIQLTYESTLGEGSYGAVVVAKDPDGNRFAVKFLKLEQVALTSLPTGKTSQVLSTQMVANTRLSVEEATAAFEREGRILKKLVHPGVPRLHLNGSYSFGPRYFIVMDLVEGDQLISFLNNPSHSVWQQREIFALKVTYDLSKILDYLQKQTPSVLYLDLKPENIMIKNTGEAMLIDFGTAVEWRPGESVPAVGTPGYAPEELYFGKGTKATDVYSLGATFHALLSGREPTASTLGGTTLLRPSQLPIPSIKSFVPSIGDDIADLVSALTAVKPEQRIPNAKAARARLEKIIRDRNLTNQIPIAP